MSNSIVLDSGEVIDLAHADASALMRGAREMQRKSVTPDLRFAAIARDTPAPKPQYDMASVNSVRIDFDYEQDAAEGRQRRALAEITKALAIQEAEAKQKQADTRSRLREQAGGLSKLMGIR